MSLETCHELYNEYYVDGIRIIVRTNGYEYAYYAYLPNNFNLSTPSATEEEAIRKLEPELIIRKQKIEEDYNLFKSYFKQLEEKKKTIFNTPIYVYKKINYFTFKNLLNGIYKCEKIERKFSGRLCCFQYEKYPSLYGVEEFQLDSLNNTKINHKDIDKCEFLNLVKFLNENKIKQVQVGPGAYAFTNLFRFPIKDSRKIFSSSVIGDPIFDPDCLIAVSSWEYLDNQNLKSYEDYFNSKEEHESDERFFKLVVNEFRK